MPLRIPRVDPYSIEAEMGPSKKQLQALAHSRLPACTECWGCATQLHPLQGPTFEGRALDAEEGRGADAAVFLAGMAVYGNCVGWQFFSGLVAARESYMYLVIRFDHSVTVAELFGQS
jgi:hypothetical protein